MSNNSAVVGRLQHLISFCSKGSDLEDDTGDDAKSVRTTEDNKKYVSAIIILIVDNKKPMFIIIPLIKGGKKNVFIFPLIKHNKE
jgi:hypothetical protein